ncbi:MAG: GMC family oxidoreductase [Balneolaceae bacterium]|nr:GMC family oxidoreductase [Balneolaceae bacterium]
MVLNLRSDTIPELEPYDLAVVGAGAAGITIARRLAGSGLRICLIESGDFEQEEETQSLYGGEAEGNIPDEGYLQTSRQRFFGGTTNHWTGWCRPLDPIDFAERDWVPGSGWPLDREDLEKYYRVAEELVEVHSFRPLDRIQRDWNRSQEQTYGFRAPFYQWSPPTRFGQKYRSDLEEAGNIDIFINANLTNIRLGDSRRRVRSLEVSSLNDRQISIDAEKVVLACGGIENPRILLNCRDEVPEGIGNEHGLVGKYFMEHPHYDSVGLAMVWDLLSFRQYGPWAEFSFKDRDGVLTWRVFSPDERLQREEGLLNIAIYLDDVMVLNDPDLDEDQRQFAEALARTSERLMENTSLVDRLAGKAIFDITNLYTYRIMAEPMPRASNAVTLVNEQDELGMQRAHLTSQVHPDEVENYRRSLRLLASALGRMGEGRLRLDLDEESTVGGGNHHMGTTRMSERPEEGVVDSNCRVHSVENLYIAGSSVFPTAGFANPTLTLVALAARLADHLEQEAG